MRLTKYAGYTRPAPVPRMPPGLVELMEGLTKEVLRHNPPDVYEFCANHIEELLVIRDGRAPKNILTLEQKISRAQQKVRERALQRHRKYDEEIKKYVEDMKSSSKAQDEPANDKLKSPECIQDNKLKVPVHHEQDLTNDLEVEIFHKPIEEAKIGKVFATNFETINNTNDDIKNNVELQKDQKVEELEQSKSKDSTQEQKSAFNLDSDTDGILDSNKFSSFDDNIVENDKENVSSEHNIARRSTAPQEVNEEIEQSTLEVDSKKTLIEKPQEEADLLNYPESTMEDVKDILIEKKEQPYDVANTERNEKENIEVSDPSVTEENDTGIDSSNNKNDTTDQLEKKDLEEQENVIDKVEVVREKGEIQTLDGEGCDINGSIPTQDFNDEVTINVTSELESPDVKIESNLNKSYKGVDETKDEKVTQILEPTEEKKYDSFSEKMGKIKEAEEKADDQINDSDELTTIDMVAVDEMLLGIENDELKHGFTEPDEIKNGTYSQKKDLDITEEMKNKTEIFDQGAGSQNADTHSVFIGDTELGDQNKESPEEDIDTVDMSETKIESQKENPVSAEMESSSRHIMADDIVSEERVMVEQDNTVDIITATEPSDFSKSEYNTNVVEDSKLNKETVSPKNESGSAIEEYGDGFLTTVNTVLVDESAIVKDDNDSVPEPAVKMTTTDVTNQNVSGTYENGKGTPDSEVIFNIEDISNQVIEKVQIIPDIQVNTSTTSEPIKTDNETSSMGKSSSMDDSFIDDSNNSILEVDLKETNAECTPNKYSSSSMDLETAAVTIQKVFRSFLFKSRGSTFDDTGADGNNSIDNDNEKVEVQFPVSTTTLNKERRTLGISRMDTVLQTVNEEKSLSLSTDDSSLSSAATIIQAHVRGFLVRNRRNSNKTNSTSLVNSDGRSTSLETDGDQKTNKTVLNIHIVPEGDNFLSRDESLLTSIDLSLDGSPPSSTNLHPLGYDKSEPRKQLKREDAIQSISPPSNNSGKLSEDLDSVKDLISDGQLQIIDSLMNEPQQNVDIESLNDTATKSTTIETVIEAHEKLKDKSSSPKQGNIDPEISSRSKRSIVKYNSDENDVITPFEEKESYFSGNTSHLLHSGEFHDVVLPTKISRSDTSVVREFKNVLAYFIIWNNC